MNTFMKEAIKEAIDGISNGHGGPFGAVVVSNGIIVGRGHNLVISTNDPTSHGEIVAIREASKFLSRFDLSDCELYTTCEPCPMCYGAIHWARIKKVYYGCTKDDARRLGFDDELLSQILKRDDSLSSTQLIQIDREECYQVFLEYEKDENKIIY